MYRRAVRQPAEHYHKSPEQITEEELRDYFLYLKVEQAVYILLYCPHRFAPDDMLYW